MTFRPVLLALAQGVIVSSAGEVTLVQLFNPRVNVAAVPGLLKCSFTAHVEEDTPGPYDQPLTASMVVRFTGPGDKTLYHHEQQLGATEALEGPGDVARVQVSADSLLLPIEVAGWHEFSIEFMLNEQAPVIMSRRVRVMPRNPVEAPA